jgi:hypothetical protein
MMARAVALVALLIRCCAAQCVLSGVDTTPLRVADALVCPQFAAFACCSSVAQRSIAAHHATLRALVGADETRGACAFNALQLSCTALCSVEQALGVDVANGSLTVHVDAAYADALWLSCRERCGVRNVFSGVDELLASFGTVLAFDDYGVNATWNVSFVRRSESATRGAVLVAPSRNTSLARRPCGDDDAPCGNGNGAFVFVSRLPPCSLPVTRPVPTAATNATTADDAELRRVDAATIAATLAVLGSMAFCLCGGVLFVCWKRKAQQARLHVLPVPPRPRSARSRRDDAPRPPRARARQAHEQPPDDAMESVDDLRSAESCGGGGGETCDVCANELEVDAAFSAFALRCRSCNAVKRGICVRCGRVGRPADRFCRGCHRILPAIVPSPASLAAQADCAICLEAMATCASAVELPCKHVFHRDCFVQTMLSDDGKFSSKCPLCNRVLKKNAPATDE